MCKSIKDADVKCQLLSLVVNQFSKTDLLTWIPEITKYQIDKARKHAFVNGPGSCIQSSKTQQHRQRINYAMLQHAVEFFSDPSFNQISSYTTHDLKLDSGDILVIPDVVRTVIHSNLIKLYKLYCADNDFNPLSDSTLYQVLNACEASKRKCLKGLDNIAVDGTTAFDNILSLISKLNKTEDWKSTVKSRLLNSRLYLKTDYKLHIRREDECAFHCLQYSLSDPKVGALSVGCEHLHQKACDRCLLLGDIVEEVRLAILSSCPEDQEAFLQDLEISTRQIEDWRSHILRTINQDDARFDLLNSIQGNEVIIIMDWAMKYLPQMFRERMKDFFGQKGMHWHVCVAIFKDEDNSLKHKTFTHLMDHVKQDFFAVLSLLEHTLSSIKKQLPQITEAYLRSDNAGCYHCGQLWLAIPSLSERTGIQIKRYDYSEAQSGKSYCDAKIAHMRQKMRIFSAEGHNITTAMQMKEAIDSGAGVKGVYTSVVDVDTTKHQLKTHSWKGVSFITNVEYTSSGIKTWKAYRIGDGCFIDNNKVKQMFRGEQPATCLQIISDDFQDHESSGHINLKQGTSAEIHEQHVSSNQTALANEQSSSSSNQSIVIEQQIPESSNCTTVLEELDTSLQDHEGNNVDNVFYCPEYGCTKAYQSFEKMQDHILIGKHSKQLLNDSTYDRAKKIWAEKCENLQASTHVTIESDPGTSSSNNFNIPAMGWALKKEKKYVRFSQNVKSYLTELFKIGEASGKKENPAAVAMNMRNMSENGSRKFSPNEWLQPSQIASFFSRLAMNAGKTIMCIDSCDLDAGDSDLLAVLNELENQEIHENLNL
ncbi:uncharacterized protein LOC127732770 [Mytilus californianus]|uniref:uncharacterized protein LOC127732770 n=1 Tax=Mytilus californianus TaxID=6549 RepID=UPI002246A778|nr:uncharacterized protein LOC127732770 [Mytilus californianus]